jgi:hypothetical protein
MSLLLTVAAFRTHQNITAVCFLCTLYKYSLISRMFAIIWIRTLCCIKVEVMLLPTASLSVCLGSRHPSRDHDHIFITVRYWRVCWRRALSLTRGRCRLQLLLGLSSSVSLGSESCWTHSLSQIWDSPNLGCQVPVFMSPQENGVPVITPGTGFHPLLLFVCS